MVMMMWEDVTVERPASFGAQRKKLLLSGITGFAEPARVMAVMGPSGCGKTTFLDSLTGLSLSLFLYISYYNLVSSQLHHSQTQHLFISCLIFIITVAHQGYFHTLY